MILWMTLSPAFGMQGVKEDEEACKKVQEAFRAAYRNKDEAGRSGATSVFGDHSCGHCAGLLGQLLLSEASSVRSAAAQALGKMDSPKAVELLAQAVEPNHEIPEVLDAIAKALQTLDYEVGATILNPILKKLSEKEVVDALGVIIPVLGKIGSSTSVDPLIDLLQRAENEASGAGGGRRRLQGNPKIAALAGPVRKALEEITGGREGTYRAWEAWWKAGKDRQLASATIIFRCPSTGKRWSQKAGEAVQCPNHDKTEKHGAVVKTKLGR
jgi:HEAT repeat protein